MEKRLTDVNTNGPGLKESPEEGRKPAALKALLLNYPWTKSPTRKTIYMSPLAPL